MNKYIKEKEEKKKIGEEDKIQSEIMKKSKKQ